MTIPNISQVQVFMTTRGCYVTLLFVVIFLLFLLVLVLVFKRINLEEFKYIYCRYVIRL